MPPNYNMEKYLLLMNEVKDKILFVKQNGQRIFYLEETEFTKRTYQRKTLLQIKNN